MDIEDNDEDFYQAMNAYVEQNIEIIFEIIFE